MDWWLSLWSRSRRLNSPWQTAIPRRHPSSTCPNRSATASFMTVWIGTIGTCSISQSLHLETSRRAPRREPQKAAPRWPIGSRPSKTTRPKWLAAMMRWRLTTLLGYGRNWASLNSDDEESRAHIMNWNSTQFDRPCNRLRMDVRAGVAGADYPRSL